MLGRCHAIQVVVKLTSMFLCLFSLASLSVGVSMCSAGRYPGRRSIHTRLLAEADMASEGAEIWRDVPMLLSLTTRTSHQ